MLALLLAVTALHACINILPFLSTYTGLQDGALFNTPCLYRSGFRPYSNSSYCWLPFGVVGWVFLGVLVVVVVLASCLSMLCVLSES